MKAIEYTTEQELDISDAVKLNAYQQNVSNSDSYIRFSEKIEKDGKWYMFFNPELSNYFTDEEKSRIIEI